MIKLFQNNKRTNQPVIQVPVHNVLFIKTAECGGGHKCRINPAFVMTRIPCSENTYCTDESDFLFYAEGETYEQVNKSLGNKLCHFWQIYGDLDPDTLESNPELKEMRDHFKDRVVFDNDVREMEE